MKGLTISAFSAVALLAVVATMRLRPNAATAMADLLNCFMWNSLYKQ